MILEEHPFIQSIPESRRPVLLTEVEVRNYARSETIFSEQSAPDSMYLLLEGTVSFGKAREDGNRHIVSHSVPGEFFGEVGVFTGDLRALDARADSDCSIARISETTFHKIIEDAAPLRKILESIISHLSSTTTHYMTDLMRTEKLSLVGTMMASILHDFRNPFSIISLGAHFISQRHKEDDKTQQICSNIESQIRRMVDMANDLSAFSRGDEAIETIQISAEELLEQFRMLNEPYFSDPLIPIELKLDPVTLDVDPAKINRVLQNLITNAREAIEGKSGQGKIKILCQKQADQLILEVSDNGPGIPADIQDRFFEPFVTSGKINGTGLGSAIVQSIIQAHQGEISFKTGDQGTTFTIALPA